MQFLMPLYCIMWHRVLDAPHFIMWRLITLLQLQTRIFLLWRQSFYFMVTTQSNDDTPAPWISQSASPFHIVVLASCLNPNYKDNFKLSLFFFSIIAWHSPVKSKKKVGFLPRGSLGRSVSLSSPTQGACWSPDISVLRKEGLTWQISLCLLC